MCFSFLNVEAVSPSILLSAHCRKSKLLLSLIVIFFPFLSSCPGSPSLSGTGTVTVLVNDVNDNVPVFASSTFHTTIMEDAPTGTDVLLVNSSDADVGINGVIRYPHEFAPLWFLFADFIVIFLSVRDFILFCTFGS